uniref:Ankyrin repeat domain 13A n=1 Tax=Cyprinus carpio TaxID=7962 RepID=A0A8C2HPM8_CYPCA
MLSATAASIEDFSLRFPLHALVWENDYRSCMCLHSFQSNIEEVDPRGRTPLHLAVSLGHLESVRVLLRHGADVSKENDKNWTVLQEAVSTGDPEMVQLVLQRRDYLKASTALGGVPELLCKIRESPDFYMEMKWEFTSWIPLVSRVCPSDVCRIWKSGACLRVDTTLLGFENMTWIRGRRSYIFRGEDNSTELMEVNHEDEVVDTERFDLSREMEDVTLDSMQPAVQEVAKRLTTPIVNTYLDTKNIAFERSKSGIWGWRSDRTEVVNGFESKDMTMEYATATNPTAITPEEYFNPNFDLQGRDIGRPIELTIRTQKFKGTLWMSEEHPLSLVEQVTPIIDLMARTSTHFARLKDFINLRFPPGFPVKIEIPLFHVLNARITFGNVNKCSTDEPLDSNQSASTPTPTEEKCDSQASGPALFKVCPSVFVAPSHYHHRGGYRPSNTRHYTPASHDEELLQYAIHQSLLESSALNSQVRELPVSAFCAFLDDVCL